MKHRRYWVVPLAVLLLGGVVWAAAGAGASTGKASATKVTLQLKWVTQAQFAGYYAAAAKGYYKQAGLDVKIKVGGPDISPEQVVAGGVAPVWLDMLSSPMAVRGPRTNLIKTPPGFTRSRET